MRTTLSAAIVATWVASGCVTRPRPGAIPGEVRGLYTSGFEASHFRPCDDPPGFGARIAFDSAAAQSLARWTDATSAAWRGFTYVSYLRWVVQNLPEPPLLPAGVIRISNGPKQAVTRILEVRAPLAGECGWQPGVVPGAAP